MIYCPNIYNQAAFNTWMDKKTFLLLDKAPEDVKEDMEKQTPPSVRRHYKKLLDYTKPIPYGYIMMKRKKQWLKGRTIIAYSNTCVGRLLRVAALALQQMLKNTWPHHFGNVATPQLWQEVHELFLANEDKPERELIFLNHDLVGFFNSIPQADIIQSVRYLIAEFSKNNNDIILIDPYRKLNPVHSGTSTHSIKSNMTKLNVQHIVDIIQFSFDACAFTAIGEVFRQTCGTSMGNQISRVPSSRRRSPGSVSSANTSPAPILLINSGSADTSTTERSSSTKMSSTATPISGNLHLYISTKSQYSWKMKTVTTSWASASMRTTDKLATTCTLRPGATDCLSQQALGSFVSVGTIADDI